MSVLHRMNPLLDATGVKAHEEDYDFGWLIGHIM